MIRAFFQRLLDRGHNHDKVREVFLQTAHQLVSNHNNSKQSNKNKNQEKSNDTYLKWRYHPADTSPKIIQKIYKTTCKQPTGFSASGFQNLPTETGARMHINKLTIAFTRDRNIRNLLIPSRLRNFPEYSVRLHLDSMKGDNDQDNNNNKNENENEK